MGIAYNTSIVRDGLVLHLDAANVKSYPGSGTVWKDLSGNGNHGTLVNGVGYSTDNKGSMVFDGVDDGVTTINVSTFVNLTICIWLYDLRTTGQRDILTYNGNAGSYTFGGLPLFRTDGNGINASKINSTNLPSNKWTHFVYSKNGNLTLNGVSYSPYAGSDTPYGMIEIGGSRSDVSSRLRGNVSVVQIYNRNLSGSEIQQNFEALRGRYGL